MEGTMIKRKEDILFEIEEKLKEEKWTRAAIESYTMKNFIELDSYIKMAIDGGFKEELKTLCKENLKHYQNSIVGLYIVGVLSLEESSIDDAHIPQIVKIFMDNKKYKIAEFLAEKILTYRENKFALRTLETIYENQGNQDELFNIKKRLVLVDNKDANNAKFLGEYYEKEQDKDQAMFYYRIALERYLTQKSVKMVEEMWNKIIKLFPEDYNIVITLAKKIREVLGNEKTSMLVYNDYVKNAMKKGDYKSALKVLKVILEYNPDDKGLRKSLEECYRAIYSGHSQLDKFIKQSAINQSWKQLREAIQTFETHVAFDKGAYVLHKSWGIGVIKKIENDKVFIDFDDKKEHEMTLQIALRALTVLDKDNILVWKKFRKDELKKLLAEDPLKVIENILKNNNGKATTNDIKTMLVPDVIEEKEWTKFWNNAKSLINSSDFIVQSLDKKNLFELREKEITVIDEIISKFKKSTTLENKLKLALEFINRSGDINSKVASSIVNYFLELWKASSETNDKKLISYLFLKYSNCNLFQNEDIDASIIFGIKNLNDFYESLDNELKESFLLLILNKLKDWDYKYADFIKNTSMNKLDNLMLKKLIQYEKYDIINDIFLYAINNFQEKPELFTWCAKIIIGEEEKELNEKIGIKDSEIIFRLLTLYEILSNEIESKSNIGRNKKIIDTINDLLFKKNILDKFIENEDETILSSLVSILNASFVINDQIKNKYINKITEKYPNLKVTEKPEKVKTRHLFIVTKKALEQKKKELQRIISVEIPENSRAIGEAMEKGDLRENAEYKAALEKQDQLKAAAAKLESEINQAKILDKNDVNLSRIDVGTKVKLKTKDNKIVEYQILGQWEVDLKKNIISYLSPLGKLLLDKKVGDIIEFEQESYEVISIDYADFE